MENKRCKLSPRLVNNNLFEKLNMSTSETELKLDGAPLNHYERLRCINCYLIDKRDPRVRSVRNMLIHTTLSEVFVSGSGHLGSVANFYRAGEGLFKFAARLMLLGRMDDDDDVAVDSGPTQTGTSDIDFIDKGNIS